MTEMQSIVGINELARLETWNLPRRFEYAKMYREALGKLEGVKSLPVDTEERQCAYWWFPIILDLDKLDIDAPAFLKKWPAWAFPATAFNGRKHTRKSAYKELGGFGSHKFPFCSKEYTREGLTYEGVVCPVAKEPACPHGEPVPASHVGKGAHPESHRRVHHSAQRASEKVKQQKLYKTGKLPQPTAAAAFCRYRRKQKWQIYRLALHAWTLPRRLALKFRVILSSALRPAFLTRWRLRRWRFAAATIR